MVKKIAIVSLSDGILGEQFVQHEVEIGLRRLKEHGFRVEFMPHAKAGMEYIKNHPEDRAKDLLQAIEDDSVDMILCAIGGDDTYRLLPYLFEHDELKHALEKSLHNKLFLGFSDTTMNHLMFHKLGVNTFYGQAFLPDLCEMEPELLPYTAHYFEELTSTGMISEICPIEVWYMERTDWSEASVGVSRIRYSNDGFHLLQGRSRFEGEILGGCIESICDMFGYSKYEDLKALCEKYELFPKPEDWKGKILLLETSESQPTPEHYRTLLEALKNTEIFEVISGILCGKPMDEKYMEEYNRIIVEVVDNKNLPIVTNINVGHATPRCIIPFGVHAVVDTVKQTITFDK